MENKARKQQPATTRTSKSANRRKEKKYKSAKLFRRKSLRSVGQFVSRLLKTLGTLAHLGDAGGPPPPDAEDDDGGFKECSSALKSATSGNHSKNDDHHHHDEVHGAAHSVKKSSSALLSSSHGSAKERLSRCFGDKTPGAQGLKNHGNTCFMNAVVQCLSNTDLLAEYLGLERYKWDMCRDRTGVNGLLVKHGEQEEEDGGGGGGEQQQGATRGEVTEQLASLVRALWTLEYTPQISVDFKVRGSGTTRPALSF